MNIGPKIESAPSVAPSVAPSSRISPSEPRSDDAGPSPFARLLHGMGNEVDRGEALNRAALAAPPDLDQGALLGLQAGVYRYSETVDLASKLVDHTTSGVKTVLQGSGG